MMAPICQENKKGSKTQIMVRNKFIVFLNNGAVNQMALVGMDKNYKQNIFKSGRSFM